MTSIERYSYLWDGSEPGWVLHRLNHQVVSLTLLFERSEPSVCEMKAIRLSVPAYHEMSVSPAVAELRGKRSINLGEFESREARQIAEACRKQGLAVHEDTVDKSGFLMCNEKTNMCLLIEDDRLSEAVKDEALRRGIPVRHIEA